MSIYIQIVSGCVTPGLATGRFFISWKCTSCRRWTDHVPNIEYHQGNNSKSHLKRLLQCVPLSFWKQKICLSITIFSVFSPAGRKRFLIRSIWTQSYNDLHLCAEENINWTPQQSNDVHNINRIFPLHNLTFLSMCSTCSTVRARVHLSHLF